jgi:hypothetical protein
VFLFLFLFSHSPEVPQRPKTTAPVTPTLRNSFQNREPSKPDGGFDFDGNDELEEMLSPREGANYLSILPLTH